MSFCFASSSSGKHSVCTSDLDTPSIQGSWHVLPMPMSFVRYAKTGEKKIAYPNLNARISNTLILFLTPPLPPSPRPNRVFHGICLSGKTLRRSVPASMRWAARNSNRPKTCSPTCPRGQNAHYLGKLRLSVKSLTDPRACAPASVLRLGCFPSGLQA